MIYKIKLFLFDIKMTYKASKTLVFLMILSSLAQVFRMFLNIILPKLIIDNILGEVDTKIILLYAALLVIANSVLIKVPSVFRNYMNKSVDRVRSYVDYEVFKKTLKLEYGALENPQMIGLKEQVDFLNGTQMPIINVLMSSINIAIQFFVLISVAIISFSFDWRLSIVLLSLLLISVYKLKKLSSESKGVLNGLEGINRKLSSLINAIFNDDTQKDLRIYGAYSYLNDKIGEYNSNLGRRINGMWINMGRTYGLINLMNIVAAVMSYIFVGIRAAGDYLGPKISLGDFALYSGAISQFITAANLVIIDISRVSQMLMFMEPMYKFMHLKERDDVELLTDKDIEKNFETINSIEFKNVSFSYPGTDVSALENISFKIERGEKISIAGLNGAGKTTIVKLLAGLYSPDEGEILINGINIRSIPENILNRMISVVFQDYSLFSMTIKENVSSEENASDEKVIETLKELNIYDRIMREKNGINSIYDYASEEGESVKLSGGESQKIAIARALYKDSPIVILDEPTSALDPKSEAEIYENFNNLVKNRIAIYISHRMSSSVFCDKVLLIDDKKVKAFANHKDLIKDTSSVYYRMFTAQQENYLIEKGANAQ